jgi:hypothetical protein
MLAHVHGQIWNASRFGRSFGVDHTTVRNYLDILTSAFVVRQLQPWHENVSKRQVKAPKVYLSDSGLLHSLLGLTTKTDLESHPILGASWEGFVVAQVSAHLFVQPQECFFWSTHAGAELDLMVVRGKKRWGFDKRTSSPRMTKSMKTALADLKLQRLYVVHAGTNSFDMAKKICDCGSTRRTKSVEVRYSAFHSGVVRKLHDKPYNMSNPKKIPYECGTPSCLTGMSSSWAAALSVPLARIIWPIPTGA